MPDLPIEFISEEIDYNLQHSDKVAEWLQNIITEHKFILENLTYIFCLDVYLF